MISDFGECEIIESNVEERKRSGATGTLEFMSPELLMKDSFGNYVSNHNPSADMWSLGVILYYLCYSCVPYEQVDDVDLLKEEILLLDGYIILIFSKNIYFPDTGDRVPNELVTLIKQLMSKIPSLRPSSSTVLALVEKWKTNFDNSGSIYDSGSIEADNKTLPNHVFVIN